MKQKLVNLHSNVKASHKAFLKAQARKLSTKENKVHSADVLRAILDAAMRK